MGNFHYLWARSNTCSNKQSRFPSYLRPLGANPRPDVHSRGCKAQASAPGFIGWDTHILPTLAVWEAKPDDTSFENSRAQLASALHPTLIILILYYLDNRESVNSVAPWWLFLFGVHYTAYGFQISAHYPRYIIEEKGNTWGFTSLIITDKFKDIFTSVASKKDRGYAITALLVVRSHTIRVFNELVRWKRGQTVLHVLKVQAMEERKRNGG